MALGDDDEWSMPTNTPDGEDPTKGRWVYVKMLDGPFAGRTVWRWKRDDGSFYYKDPGGCMIFIAVGLAGLGGGIAGIASLFV